METISLAQQAAWFLQGAAPVAVLGIILLSGIRTNRNK